MSQFLPYGARRLTLDLEIDDDDGTRVTISMPDRPGVQAHGANAVEAFGRLLLILDSSVDPPSAETFAASLENPRPESLAIAETGFAAWAESLPPPASWDPAAEVPIHWVPGTGWVEG